MLFLALTVNSINLHLFPKIHSHFSQLFWFFPPLKANTFLGFPWFPELHNTIHFINRVVLPIIRLSSNTLRIKILTLIM
ncbi:hypothetical protein E1A91_A05G079400v1 [Gossypium mustelinum]|uniref:Uncharacterized protein n=2 Tax=Gossypium TaxID=3633 RepID=A0A5D2Z2U9_GOSMU|nr:hypothetical protein ES288_A05G080000v1 [Gossypium darwinii]TYJ33095.1 hypothetical protein E1A91_A05G079400v1 [Gossypium mustelinum]